MIVKLSDYVADFLVRSDITHVFTVTGGGAMHLNDSLGHNPKLKSIYNHHEQGCAIAAEAIQDFQTSFAPSALPAAPEAQTPLPAS